MFNFVAELANVILKCDERDEERASITLKGDERDEERATITLKCGERDEEGGEQRTEVRWTERG